MSSPAMAPYVWGVDHETEDTYLTLGAGIEQNSAADVEGADEQEGAAARDPTLDNLCPACPVVCPDGFLAQSMLSPIPL